MSYTATYTKPYEGGWQDSPSKETPVMAENLDNYDNVIMNIENYLANTIKNDFAQFAEAGYSLELDIDHSTYVMTISLKNKAGTVISSKEIDFPIESMIINATYSEDTKILTLSLQNGQTLEVNISSIISGLVPDARMIAGIDLKDDITAEELKEALAVPGKTSELENDAGFMTKDDFIPSDSVVEMGEIKPWLYDTSGEEVVVGVYDGKPLYQKSFTYSIESITNSNLDLEIALDDAEIGFIHDAYAINSQNAKITLPYVHSDTVYLIGIFLNSDYSKIGVRLGDAYINQNLSLQQICVTIRYTKTTDTEGSGEDLMPYGLYQKDFASTSDSYMPNSKAGGLSIERIYGGVEQKRYEGKQLIPYPYYENLPKENRGVTFEDYDGKGGIIANGVSATDNQPYFMCSLRTVILKANQPYTFASNCDNENGFACIWFRDIDGSTDNISITYTEIRNGIETTYTSNYISEYKGGMITNGVTIIPSQDVRIQYDVRFVNNGATIEDAIFHPQLELGTETTEFEPYVGATASPNPNYSQDIRNVDITEIKSCCKNLIPYPYYRGEIYKNNGITYDVDSQGIFTLNGTVTGGRSSYILTSEENRILLEEGETYSVWCNRINDDNATLFFKHYYIDAYGNVESANHTAAKVLKVVGSESIRELGLAVGVYNPGETCTDAKIEIMVVKGSIDVFDESDYEAPKSSTASFTFTARAIEVSAEDDYTYEKDGKYYVADTVERTDEGYQLVQRIGEVVFDGSSDENWWKSSGNITVDEFTLVLDGFKAPYSNMLCSHFVYDRDSNEIGTFRNYCSDSWVYPHQVYFMFSEYGTTTIEAFKEWLSSNPITVQYILAVPIITKLSDADAIQLLSLKTFNEATHISTNSAVEAVIETKYGISEVGARTLRADNTALRAELRAKALEASAVNNI